MIFYKETKTTMRGTDNENETFFPDSRHTFDRYIIAYFYIMQYGNRRR